MRSRWTLGGCALLLGCGSLEPSWSTALQRMKRQPRYDVYESSAFFADGKTMQPPPAGTVPRERELSPAPLPATPELLALGRSRFRIFCAACHGAGGYGGSIVAENLPEARPPSLRTPAMAQLTATFYYTIITGGVGRMPSYAAELSPRERWAVIAYLQQRQRSPQAAADEKDDSIRGARLRRLDASSAGSGPGVSP